MARFFIILTVVAFANPVFAGETCETVTVQYESSYVKDFQKKIRTKQMRRRASLRSLEFKHSSTVSLSRTALMAKTLRLPVSTEAPAIAAK